MAINIFQTKISLFSSFSSASFFFLYFLFVSERQVSYHTMHGNFFVFFFRDSKGKKIFVRFVCEHVATESKNIYIQFAQRKSLFKATQFERKFYVLFCCKYRNMLRDQPSKNSKKNVTVSTATNKNVQFLVMQKN